MKRSSSVKEKKAPITLRNKSFFPYLHEEQKSQKNTPKKKNN